MRQPSRAPGSRFKPPLTNPTSAKDTFYTYACIALILLYEYLDDDPRHIQHAARHSKGAAANKHGGQNTPKDGSKKPKSPHPTARNVSQRDERKYPNHPRASHRPRPTTPPQLSQRHDMPARHGSGSAIRDEPRPAHAQRRDAWTRMRSVTPVKRVRWGAVRVYEYEHEHGGGEEEEVEEKEDKKVEKYHRTQRDIPPPLPPLENKKKKKGRRIWVPPSSDDMWQSFRNLEIRGPRNDM